MHTFQHICILFVLYVCMYVFMYVFVWACICKKVRRYVFNTAFNTALANSCNTYRYIHIQKNTHIFMPISGFGGVLKCTRCKFLQNVLRRARVHLVHCWTQGKIRICSKVHWKNQDVHCALQVHRNYTRSAHCKAWLCSSVHRESLRSAHWTSIKCTRRLRMCRKVLVKEFDVDFCTDCALQ